MTCIVALSHDSKIYMGSDSAGSDGWTVLIRRDPKIYRVGGMLIGFTTSFRMGQLLGYSLTLPEHHADIPIERYMATSFIDAVRGCLKTGGYATKKDEVESGGQFLVAYRNRIFEVEPDFQVSESETEFAAVGSGFMLALGSLHASAGRDPEFRVLAALGAAEAFCASVRGPMHVEVLS